MSEYLDQVTLPSRALEYETIPADITVKNMSTKEEKLIYGSSTMNAVDNIVLNCIKEPEDFSMDDLDSLFTFDKHFLMMAIRILTYGGDYKFKYKCPYCNNSPQRFQINLKKDLEIHYLDDDFVLPIELELPMSEDIVGITLLTSGQTKKIRKKAERMQRKFPNLEGDISYILRLGEFIETVNGEELVERKKQKYVEGLHGRDSAYIWDKIDNIKAGYDTTIYEQCKYNVCRSELEFELPMDIEFFRPSFDD